MYTIPCYSVPQMAPPITFNTYNWWACRLIFWHYSTRWFSLHAQSVLVLHLVGFYSLDPNPRRPITACHAQCCRGTMKWHNNPRQPVRSIQARRDATLVSGLKHPAKELRSQNTGVKAPDKHMSLCATCDCWGAKLWRNSAEQQREESQTGEMHFQNARDFSTSTAAARNTFFSVKCGAAKRF